jgi:1,6-anhydro-N-acetylmuramate kinase
LCEDEYYYQEIPPKHGARGFLLQGYKNILKMAPDEEKNSATLTALTAKTIADAYERFVIQMFNR